jgi:predicted transcriptional regulator/transcriptional regulator with XRE-family HTH domain
MQQTEPRIGSRIQRLRRQSHISQAELAGQLGISASYLNLIEHNRRRITVPLLMKVAGQFGIEPGELVENDESRLVGDLMEIFGDDVFTESQLTNQDIRDLAASNPTVGRAIVRLFDQYRALRTAKLTGAASDENAGYHPATDAVSDFIQEAGNYFPTLEEAAERVRHDIEGASDSFEYGLKTYLFNVFGLQWRMAPLPAGIARRYDPDRREILTSDVLPAESAIFSIAHQLGSLTASVQIDALIEASNLPADAPVLARNALASYFAGALLMPYEPFLKACKETRYDIERIQRRFRTSFEQVCQRMTTLQRPGRAGIPLHLVRTDIAGNISKRFSLSGIHISRHSGACPRWNVYAAFLHPADQYADQPDAGGPALFLHRQGDHQGRPPPQCAAPAPLHRARLPHQPRARTGLFRRHGFERSQPVGADRHWLPDLPAARLRAARPSADRPPLHARRDRDGGEHLRIGAPPISLSRGRDADHASLKASTIERAWMPRCPP